MNFLADDGQSGCFSKNFLVLVYCPQNRKFHCMALLIIIIVVVVVVVVVVGSESSKVGVFAFTL